MVQFRVRAESLTEVAGHLGSVIATFDGNLAAVESQVNGVLPNWEGDDQESFAENWKAFVAMSDAVRMSLVALQNGLISASGGYDATEMGVGRSMNQGRPGVVALRKGTAANSAIVATGEERAEDMAEFFGRDYAGDREKEQFGAGAVRGRDGRYSAAAKRTRTMTATPMRSEPGRSSRASRSRSCTARTATGTRASRGATRG